MTSSSVGEIKATAQNKNNNLSTRFAFVFIRFGVYLRGCLPNNSKYAPNDLIRAFPAS